jgi:glycosyltransferase involved in cell wall biosynthesis
MSNDFRVVALISAYNEGDVIGTVIGDLIRQGIVVYLIDDGSTDDTVAVAESYMRTGLLQIERAGAPGESRPFSWTRILARKEVLAATLAGDWFMHQDADEFRESPWRGMSLRDAIRAVDRRGYNAIDFQLLNFRPIDNGLVAGQDVRDALPLYELGGDWDKMQIKCWKRTTAAVDLVSSGGHDAK